MVSKKQFAGMAMMGFLALLSLLGALAGSIYIVWQAFAPPTPPAQAWAPPEGATLPIGIQAPDFAARDLNGNLVRLSDYRGKVVLLKFWSVTCGDCTTELPREQEIYKQLDANTQLLTVAVMSSEDSVRSYSKDAKIEYPVLLDPDKEVMTRYNVRMTPTVYLIDPQGTIRSIFPILANIEDIRAHIELCGASCKPASTQGS